MKLGRTAALAAGVVVAIRLARRRGQRLVHPDGRSFEGTLEIFGTAEPLGSALLDRPARYDVTLRLSKGVGTRGGRADIRGLAIRVPLLGRDLDLLFSTAGQGSATRFLPAPRRSFDTGYSTITPYRTGERRKVYLVARPDPDGPALGRTLDGLAQGCRILLTVRHAGPVGRVILGRPLPAAVNAGLAFDPVRNSLTDLHPTGLVHGTRAFAYRLSQRWRGATPAAPHPAAVTRTGAHR